MLSEEGLSFAAGWRTLLLYETGSQALAEKKSTSAVYRQGHQLIAPAYASASAFTSAYAQAIYLDMTSSIADLKEQIRRLKSSKRAFRSLTEQENVVYVGEHYIRTDGRGDLVVDGLAIDLTYTPFAYDDNYTYDRGFIQYMTSQIEASNRAILVFVAIACTFFVTAIVFSRRSIRKQLLHRRYEPASDQNKEGDA